MSLQAGAHHMPCVFNCRKGFPSYLQEGMLEAISIQALAQVSSPVTLVSFLFGIMVRPNL
jgi:hypothetical protein